MTTFKNLFGQVIAEIIETSTSTAAENFASYWNKKEKSTYNKIVEIDLHNGTLIFINK
jgi:hypothetical protein